MYRYFSGFMPKKREWGRVENSIDVMGWKVKQMQRATWI